MDPEPALALPAPGRDPEFGEMRTGETKYAASALLLHEDEQTCRDGVIAERHGPDMPGLTADVRDS